MRPRLPPCTISTASRKCGQLRCCIPHCRMCLLGADGAGQRRAFFNCVRDRLLEVHVFTGCDCIDGHLDVPVIGSRDQDCVEILRQHFLVVEMRSRRAVIRYPSLHRNAARKHRSPLRSRTCPRLFAAFSRLCMRPPAPITPRRSVSLAPQTLVEANAPSFRLPPGSCVGSACLS